MVKCSKCDADNESGAKFCEECGEKLKVSKKINKTLLYSVIGGAIFLVLVLAIVLINPFSQEKELSPQQAVCNKPYILIGNDCCLDKDDNGICDNDEKTEIEAKSEEKTDEELFLNSVCNLPAGIYCNANKITANAITLVLANELGFDITDVSVTASSCTIPATGSLMNGEQNTFTISGCSLRKDRFPMGFRITYINPDTELTHEVQGSLTEGYRCSGSIVSSPAECSNKIIKSVGEVETLTIKNDGNCIKPLIKSGPVCCMDYNDNSICDKNPTDRESDDRLLNEGSRIELNFIPGGPPNEVTDGGTFPFEVVVQLKTKDFNLEKVVIHLIGFDPADFGKSGYDLDINVGTLKPYDTKYFRFSNFNFGSKLSGNTVFVMRADVHYEYLGRFYLESVDTEVLVKHLIG